MIGRLSVAGSASSAGTTRCAVMIEPTPASIAARKGTSAASQSPEATGSARCESTAVSPWPGKCLAQATTPCACVPRTNAATWRATQLRIGAEGADADHGVVGVRVHVGDRREVQADAAVGQIGGDPACDGFGQLDVVDDAEGKVAGVRAAVLPLEPGDVAALLVDREQQARQRSRQRAQLVAVADVVREEGQPAEAALGEAQNPVRRLVTRKARQQAGRREPVECGVGHPFTAPAVSPNAIFRCTIRKKMTTGIAVSVDAAIRAPQSVLRLVPRK